MATIRLIKNEQYVLYCIINSKTSLLSIINDDIIPFISEIALDIFNACKKCVLNNLELTNAHILSECENENIKEELLNSIRNQEGIDINNFSIYYSNLKQEYAKQRFSSYILKNTVVDLSKKNDFDITVIDNYIKQAELFKELINGKSSKLLTGEQLINEYRKEIDKRFSGQITNSFGCSYLDSILTEGAAGGSITTIAAASGSGKSTFIGRLRNGLLNRRVPLVEFNTELSLAQSIDRYICSKYNIPLKDLHSKNFEEDDTKKEFIYNILDKEIESIRKNNLYRYLYDSVITLKDIDNYIRQSIKEFNSDYAVVLIDLLSMVKEFGIQKNGGNRADNIEYAMDELNHISKKYNVHIIGTVQIKRQSEKIIIKTIEDLNKLIPTENDLKSSSAYFERSRIVITLFRPYYYAQRYMKPDDPQLEILEDDMILQIIKQSQGDVGKKIKYIFNGEYFKVSPKYENITEK